MKFAVCSLYDENCRELGEITIQQNGKEYCDKWGYDLIVRTENFACPHLGFDKIDLLLNTLNTNKYDWVFWRGADTLITNFRTELSQLINENYDFVIAHDIHNYQTDSMLLKNTDRCKQFLTDIWERRNVDPEETFSLNVCRESFQDRIHLIPQKYINVYDYSLYMSPEPWNVHGIQPECAPQRDIFGLNAQWMVGDFMIHWPGIRNDKRVELAKYYTTQIIK